MQRRSFRQTSEISLATASSNEKPAIVETHNQWEQLFQMPEYEQSLGFKSLPLNSFFFPVHLASHEFPFPYVTPPNACVINNSEGADSAATMHETKANTRQL